MIKACLAYIYSLVLNCNLYPFKVIPFIPLPNKIWMVLYMDEGFVFSELEFTGKSISNVMLAVPQQVAYHHGSQ